MEFTIKGKTFNIWSKKRILYTICFFLFCVIDQRTKTGSGLDGIIETFRDMAGVLMAVIIMSHYKWEEFMAYKIPYAVWTGIGVVAGVLFVVLGQPLAYFMNERVMVSLDVLLFGYVVIHTFISDMAGTDFFRTHRAYLVHFKYVEKYDATCVTMKNGTALIAKKNYPEFVRRYLLVTERYT